MSKFFRIFAPMNNEGRQQLIDALRDTLLLAENNPCRASDSTLLALAKGLQAFLSSELSMDLSRDRAARFLNMSPRSLNRHVHDGTVPQPHRSGHKQISFSALSLAKLIRKIKG